LFSRVEKVGCQFAITMERIQPINTAHPAAAPIATATAITMAFSAMEPH
jgi:hypothetical protein